MLQSTTIDSRQPDLRTELDANHAGAIHSAAQSDFARGQRRTPGHRRIQCDFATGMRSPRTPALTGDFATGARNSAAPTTIGDFATGTRTLSPATTVEHLTNTPTTLPLAA